MAWWSTTRRCWSRPRALTRASGSSRAPARAVAQDADGRYLFAGGWGWVLGDEAGAAASCVMRHGRRSAFDQGRADDGLLAALLDAFSVTDAPALARAVNDEPTMDNCGSWAPVVLTSADAGSARAAGASWAPRDTWWNLVGQLRDRGAVGRDVVAAGSVIVRQPRLIDAFRAALAKDSPTSYRISCPGHRCWAPCRWPARGRRGRGSRPAEASRRGPSRAWLARPDLRAVYQRGWNATGKSVAPGWSMVRGTSGSCRPRLARRRCSVTGGDGRRPRRPTSSRAPPIANRQEARLPGLSQPLHERTGQTPGRIGIAGQLRPNLVRP